MIVAKALLLEAARLSGGADPGLRQLIVSHSPKLCHAIGKEVKAKKRTLGMLQVPVPSSTNCTPYKAHPCHAMHSSAGGAAGGGT